MKILIAGDYCPQNRVASILEGNSAGTVLSGVEPFVKSVDYSIVNLEAPVADKSDKKIAKSGPNLCCTPRSIEALANAGFNCLTLANNHFLDYGPNGVDKTIKVADNLGLDCVGGGRNAGEAAKILYKNIKGETLALINCCEHEFSIAGPNSAGSNPLDPIAISYAIKEAKQAANFVMVIVHGGIEEYQLPTPRMKRTYRFFIDCGADIVINHHQHCYTGYEYYNDKTIFYGLGNFSFDWEKPEGNTWNYGFLLKVDTTEGSFEMIPYEQGGINPEVKVQDNKEDFEVSIKKLNDIIEDDKLLVQEYNKLLGKTRVNYLYSLEPYNNLFLWFLYKRHLLPTFIRKRLQILNLLTCESHHERLVDAVRLLSRKSK